MKQKNRFFLIAQILLNLPSSIFLTVWLIKITIVMDAELFSYLRKFIKLSSYIASLFAVATLINLFFIRDIKKPTHCDAHKYIYIVIQCVYRNFVCL